MLREQAWADMQPFPEKQDISISPLQVETFRTT
jgi:hypothetical protein